MRYYSDIKVMDGHTAEPVDVIIGGSPCQDLSVAGQRAGLDGERSSLFLDQIRVIKEMHNRYGRNKPRYMVWENVPGALSSAGGEDFRRVLEETAKVADEAAVIPRPEKGKWTNAGCIMADGWSVAWRILDAQFWGVPQRRRRIALVADFGGQTAPEVLFERKGVSGYTAESTAARERTSRSIESGVDGTVLCLNDQGGSIMNVTSDISGTLRAQEHGHQPAICIQGNCIDRADTAECNGKGWRDDDVSYTLNTIDRPAVYDVKNFNNVVNSSPPLTATMYKDPHTVYRESSYGNYVNDGFGTLKAQGGCLGGGSESFAVSQNTVRRLTPLECERLQGYPDGWTDIGEWIDSKGKTHKTTDSARYKALGNSIALPPWRYICRKLSAMYDAPPTMGSLFDGIGGFPLIWCEINGGNSVPWACEIDEYCRAVTRRRLPQ